MFGMELCVALLSLCISLVANQNTTVKVENRQKLQEIALVRRHQMECIEETRVDPDFIAKIKRGEWRFPQSKIQLVKDWTLCVLMKSGLMTKQGVYKIDVALSKVPHKERRRVEKLIDSCLSSKAIPAPDIAFQFVKCYQRAKGNYTVSMML